MAYRKLKNFGRTIFAYYEKYPLLMNSLSGGTVYAGGEVIVQWQNNQSLNLASVKRIVEIGALGAAENGMFMLAWYKYLNRLVGNNVSTATVLIKCLLDQLFFATQQDLLFLGLCAYSQNDQFPMAVQEVKKSFLTTWLMDCAMWPLVNFVGFSLIPLKLQPSYMAVVSLFWQVYISSVAANTEREIICDIELQKIFDDIDVDKNGFIDADELQIALTARGTKATSQDIQQMISDGDSDEKDGKISFHEFKTIVHKGSALPTADLWKKIQTERRLDKGAKVAMRKLEDMKKKKDEKQETALSSASMQPAIVAAAAQEAAEFFVVNENTEPAAKSAVVGVSMLAVAAAIRKIFFRI